jgi:hypothetical protein
MANLVELEQGGVVSSTIPTTIRLGYSIFLILFLNGLGVIGTRKRQPAFCVPSAIPANSDEPPPLRGSVHPKCPALCRRIPVLVTNTKKIRRLAAVLLPVPSSVFYRISAFRRPYRGKLRKREP